MMAALIGWQRTGADIDFHEAEVYDAVDALGPEAFGFASSGSSTTAGGCEPAADIVVG